MVTAAAIILEDGAPVFYAQKRIGRNEKEFKIYKFRSMYKNAEEIHETLRKEYGCEEVSFKLKEDPRITKVGKIIRKFNIDELPQLINILKGDMSLVGPRPEVRKYVDMYTPEQMRVLDVRPGITSLASIRYRNENDILAASDNPDRTYVEKVMPDKLAIDLEYVPKANLWTDIRLIFATFHEIIVH